MEEVSGLLAEDDPRICENHNKNLHLYNRYGLGDAVKDGMMVEFQDVSAIQTLSIFVPDTIRL